MPSCLHFLSHTHSYTTIFARTPTERNQTKLNVSLNPQKALKGCGKQPNILTVTCTNTVAMLNTLFGVICGTYRAAHSHLTIFAGDFRVPKTVLAVVSKSSKGERQRKGGKLWLERHCGGLVTF